MEEYKCLKHAHCRRTSFSNADLITHSGGCRAEISDHNTKIPKISQDGDFGVVRESPDFLGEGIYSCGDIDFRESPLEILQFEELKELEELDELQDYDWM